MLIDSRRDALVEVVVDAGPLIYLAKLDAFDVFATAGRRAVVPPSVLAETARPELAFRHPEAAIIGRAATDDVITVVALEGIEREFATGLSGRTAGLHAGELEVLALGYTRGWPVCLHERQASRLARGMGIETVDTIELLFDGTPDRERLRERIRSFAALTNMVSADLDQLLSLIEEGKR